MSEETTLHTTDPVELLESALAYAVNADRLVKLASERLAAEPLSDSSTRVAYRHVANLRDKGLSIQLVLAPLSSRLETAIGLSETEGQSV